MTFFSLRKMTKMLTIEASNKLYKQRPYAALTAAAIFGLICAYILHKSGRKANEVLKQHELQKLKDDLLRQQSKEQAVQRLLSWRKQRRLFVLFSELGKRSLDKKKCAAVVIQRWFRNIIQKKAQNELKPLYDKGINEIKEKQQKSSHKKRVVQPKRKQNVPPPYGVANQIKTLIKPQNSSLGPNNSLSFYDKKRLSKETTENKAVLSKLQELEQKILAKVPEIQGVVEDFNQDPIVQELKYSQADLYPLNNFVYDGQNYMVKVPGSWLVLPDNTPDTIKLASFFLTSPSTLLVKKGLVDGNLTSYLIRAETENPFSYNSLDLYAMSCTLFSDYRAIIKAISFDIKECAPRFSTLTPAVKVAYTFGFRNQKHFDRNIKLWEFCNDVSEYMKLANLHKNIYTITPAFEKLRITF